MTDFLANELRWTLWNDMWAVVNHAKAWTFVKKKNHKELAQKAAEDTQRAGKHAKKAEEMGLIGGDAIRILRTFAVAAGNEVARYILHTGEFEQKFDSSNMLMLESAGVRNDSLFVNRAWESVMEAIKKGAAHIYYTEFKEKDKATVAKADFDRLMKHFGIIVKANIKDRDEFHAKAAKEAMEKAAADATENEKARSKAEKKAAQLRSKWKTDMGKKAADARKDWFSKQTSPPPALKA